MKLAIASEHRDFFSKNGYIEFADLITAEQLVRLNQDLRQALVNRLKLLSHASLDTISPGNLFVQGRDLWRTLPALKKIVFNPSLAEIAWEFCQERPLRIGYDQFMPAQITGREYFDKVDPYKALLASTNSLAALSSIQGLACGLLICLSDHPDVEPAGIFPTVPGHGIYLSVDTPLDFTQLNKNCNYLLITYAIRKSVFIHNEHDPLNYTLKQWGYTLSDALSDKLNPIILR